MKVLKRVRPGDVLIKEEPFVYALSSKVHSEYCDNCLKKGKLLKCSGCQYVYYCGKGCQRESWSVHKPECRSIKRVLPRVIPDSARLLARLIRKLQKGGDLIKGYYTETNFRMFKDLMSHYPDIKENQKKMEHFVSLYGVLSEVLQGETVPNSAELMGMYGRMCINSFNISDGELTNIGVGIYLGASIVDHSCKPNAVAMFEGTTLTIRALVEMPCIDWSQIFISYIDILNTPKERQDQLNRTYYFLCQCSKCLNPKEPEFMSAAACPSQNCDAIVDMKSIHSFLEKKCQACNTKIDGEFIKKYQEVTEFSEEQLQNMHTMAYLDICKICLAKQEGVLHKHNLQHVKMLDLAFHSSIDFRQWQQAIEYGKELVPAFRLYYGDIHPLLGLLYFKLGKILVYEEKLTEAMVYLKEAAENLKITHGASHSLFRQELMPLLQQTKLEIDSF